MQLGVALHRKAASLFDDSVVQFIVGRLDIRYLDRCDNLARQNEAAPAHQKNRHRTVTQQVPVQRGEEGPLERGLMLNLLDQHVGLHVRDVFNDVLLHVLSPGHLGGHLYPPATQIFGLSLKPAVMILQVALSTRFSIALFKQR
ncbi:hypothetical protein D9M73_227500 [compost metagenome]